jgi:hypothetical protein
MGARPLPAAETVAASVPDKLALLVPARVKEDVSNVIKCAEDGVAVEGETSGGVAIVVGSDVRGCGLQASLIRVQVHFAMAVDVQFKQLVSFGS